MKRSIFIIAALISGFYSNAQKVNNADVPAAVKTTLDSLYANVTGVTWGKEDGNYEATFNQGTTEISVTISPDGKLQEQGESITADALPQGAKDYLSKNLAGKSIKDATRIKDAKGNIIYEAGVGEYDYDFDEKGNYLRKEADND